MTSFFSSFHIIIVVFSESEAPDCSIFPKISSFAADAAAVNPNSIKKLLVDGASTFFINDKTTFINVPRSPAGNLAGCIILDTEDFHNSLFTNELFAKAL